MDGSKRIVVVTGAAGGIGRAAVQRFLQDGWNVVAVDRREPAAGCDGARFATADVGDASAVARLFGDIAEREGRVDAVVNNAAVQLCRPIEEVEPDEWDRTMAANVRSVYLMVKASIPLLPSGGAIVNLSSVHALASSRHMSAYAASKGALAALTRALAVELAPRGIRVNAVLPGAVDTPMLAAGLVRTPSADRSEREAALDALASRTPLGRVGRPEEVAELILYLSDSRLSAFVTGACLVIDGGATARLSTE